MKYPEHQKLKAVKDKSQAIGEFLDWLSEQGIYLCKLQQEEYMPHYYRINGLLAEYFGIDENKLEAEKRTMLEECRTRIIPSAETTSTNTA